MTERDSPEMMPHPDEHLAIGRDANGPRFKAPPPEEEDEDNGSES